MNILICFLSGLGNMLLFTPTLQAIRSKFPDARIALWSKQAIASEVISHYDIIDDFLTYHPKALSKLHCQYLEILNLRKQKFDVVITTFIEEGFKVRLLAKIIKGKRTIGYSTDRFTDRWFTDLLDYTEDEHECERHFKIARTFDDSAIKQLPCWQLTKQDRCFIKSFEAQNNLSGDDILLGIHPGCSEGLSYKRWSKERFAEVADKISKKHDLKILLFGGKEESGLCREILEKMKTEDALSLAGKTTLLETAALISRCNYFISNDSGLMHLAAATGTPQIALFGHTSITKNSPVSKTAIVIDGNKPGNDSKDSVKNITAQEVLEKFEMLKTGLLKQW